MRRDGVTSRNVDAQKHVGITVFDGFALPEAASIMEVFQSASALAKTTQCSGKHYDICLLSVAGGRIESSPSGGPDRSHW